MENIAETCSHTLENCMMQSSGRNKLGERIWTGKSRFPKACWLSEGHHSVGEIPGHRVFCGGGVCVPGRDHHLRGLLAGAGKLPAARHLRPDCRRAGNRGGGILLPDTRHPHAALRQRHHAHPGFRAGGHGSRAAAAEIPVEVRGDFHHRAAGVLCAVHSRPNYFCHNLWLDIASVT